MFQEPNREMPTESTGAMNILQLPSDCLYKILSSKCLSFSDWCTLVKTHSHFKEIVQWMLRDQLKNCTVRLEGPGRTNLYTPETRRIFFFGPVNDLSICGYYRRGVVTSNYSWEFERLLDWAIELDGNQGSNTVESMELEDVSIGTEQALKLKPLFDKVKKISLSSCRVDSGSTLFGSCESLIELNLVDVQFLNFNLEWTNTFPKFLRLNYRYTLEQPDSFCGSIGNVFFSRLQNLKELCLRRKEGISQILKMVADNCKQLEELEIQIEPNENDAYIEEALSSITLEHLNKMKIDCSCSHRNITKFIEELKDSKSLELLTLRWVAADSEFITALSKLTRLRVLELRNCQGLTNLNPLADLEGLTELKIYSHSEYLVFDLVRMMKHLINLKTLHFFASNFKMDQGMYLRLVDVLRRRPDKFQDALQITCPTANDGSANSLVEDGDYSKIVKIINKPLQYNEEE